MVLPTIMAAMVAGGLGCALALLFQRLLSASRCELVSTEWLSRFSVARYRPLERLLSHEDYHFLEKQKGYHPRIVRRLRGERIKVFRAYLKCISSDFRRLEAVLGSWMALAPEDRPDLAKALLRRRLLFAFAVLRVRGHLLLYGFGLDADDVHRLVGSLDDMRVHLRQIVQVRPASLG